MKGIGVLPRGSAAVWLALLAAPLSVQAHEPDEDHRHMLRHWDSIHIDQDLFAFGLNQDRNYTMGLMFVWQGDKAKQHKFNTAGVLEPIDNLFWPRHPGDARHTVAWGNSAFTPDKLQETTPITDDRPYSSLLYTTTTLTGDIVPGTSARSTSLTLGILGLRISDYGQTVIHEYIRGDGDLEPYEPRGWLNQISEGGEPTFMYRTEWFNRPWASSTTRQPGLNSDLTYSWDMSVGYYTMGSVGAVYRIGWFAPGQDVAAAVTDSNPQGGINKSRGQALPEMRGHQFYLMLGVRATLVGYNALLQGQFRDSAFELKNGDIERVVHEAHVGANWTWPSGHRFWINCTQRSAEHKLAQRRAHTWCGVNYQIPLE